MAASISALPATTSLSRPGFSAELRALMAVARKEWLSFVRYPTWIVSLVIWPVIFPASYILLARALAGPDGSGLASFTLVTGTKDFLGYIAVGTTIWMWQNVVLWNVGMALRWEQLRGTLETNWLTPTWRFSFLLGNSLTQMVNMVMFITISAVEFALIFGVRYHGNPFLILLMFLAAIPAIYGLGITFASLVITAKEANNFVFLVRGMVMIFCGMTFPISVMPGWMQGVAKWLPQTYMIHGLRSAILDGASLQTLLPDLAALAAFGAFWLLVGYLAFNRMDRRARQTGAISQY